MAHELRTPITSLHGVAQLLDRDVFEARVHTELVAEMAEESTRLVRFLEDLLALADATAGAIRVEPVLVQRILDEVLSRIRREHPHVAVQVASDASPGPVLADPEALRHALTNLLGHAVRAARDGRPVPVMLSTDGGRVMVTVQEPMHRPSPRDDLLDRGDASVEPGGRLWLASAQALVRAMGGELHVTRQGANQTLRLTLREVPEVEA